MSFIETTIKNARKIEPSTEEHALIEALLDNLENLTYPQIYDEFQIQYTRRLALAAIFDLLVAATYYGVIRNTFAKIQST